MNQLEYDIFLSYQWGHKDHVRKLYDKLKQSNFTVWMDDKELEPSSLMAQLAKGIVNSRIFMCCVTQKYSESKNCKNEVSFATTKKKPMIILMFEHFDNIPEGFQIKINTQRR